MDFQALIDAAAGASDAAARQQAVRDALAAGDNPDLTALEQAAAAAFADLAEPTDAGFNSETVEQMAVIADVVDAIRAQAASQSAAARVAELSHRVGTPKAPVATEPPQQPDQPTEPASEPETQPATEPGTEPATEPADQPGGPAEPAESITPTEPPAVTPEKELVVAAGRPSKAPQVPLATLPKQLPAQRPGLTANPFTITAAADVPGFQLGSQLNDLDGLTDAVMARFQQLARGGGDYGGARTGIAAISIERDSQFVAETQHDWHVIERACDESRLPGGSLTAAGTPGWCAPCEIDYTFCPIATVEGIVDLPTVTARRGCLIWPQSPSFDSIYSGIGWCFTPEQIDNMQQGTPNPVIGPSEKPCYQIPCPGTNELTLDPCGLCIQASILHERAYPEMIRYTVQQALAAWAHKMNCKVLSEMTALATPVDLTTNLNLGPGAAATVLEGVELQVEWMRYRYRLGLRTTIEMVAPAWVRGILRADLSKRMGVDLLNVSDETLDRYLRDRGVRIQWVVDWQDAFCDTTQTAGPNIPNSPLFGGGATPQTAWPTSVQFLLYPAGTFFLARMDIINLEAGLLDSTLLRKNERIVLFAEEAMAVGKRCYDASLVTLPLCASGQTGSGARVDCGMPSPYVETAPTP